MGGRIKQKKKNGAYICGREKEKFKNYLSGDKARS
jgi:hypothetical protein